MTIPFVTISSPAGFALKRAKSAGVVVKLSTRDNSMNDLWLDDERDPNDPQIQEQFGSAPEMVWVKTAYAAIGRLKSGNVRWISIDHDLESGTTGLDVAKWIEERSSSGELSRLMWTVHSTNVEGAKLIRKVMRNADRFWDQSEGQANIKK